MQGQPLYCTLGAERIKGLAQGLICGNLVKLGLRPSTFRLVTLSLNTKLSHQLSLNFGLQPVFCTFSVQIQTSRCACYSKLLLDVNACKHTCTMLCDEVCQILPHIQRSLDELEIQQESDRVKQLHKMNDWLNSKCHAFFLLFLGKSVLCQFIQGQKSSDLYPGCVDSRRSRPRTDFTSVSKSLWPGATCAILSMEPCWHAVCFRSCQVHFGFL